MSATPIIQGSFAEVGRAWYVLEDKKLAEIGKLIGWRVVLAAVITTVMFTVGCSKDDAEKDRLKDPPNMATLPMTDGSLPPSAPVPKSGKEALDGAVAAYKSLKSLHVMTESDTEMSMGDQANKSHQTSVLRLQNSPSKFYVQVRDSGFGTVEFVADGSTFVIYAGVQNAYKRYSGDTTFEKQYARLSRNGPQLMSALDFLQVHSTSLAGLTDLKITGEETIKGRKAYIVKGKFTDAFLADFAKKIKVGEGLVPNGGTATLWLSKDQLLLVKSNVNMGWQGTMKDEKGRPFRVAPRLVLDETVLDMKLNPGLHPDQFRFLPRTGAKEVFVEGAGS